MEAFSEKWQQDFDRYMEYFIVNRALQLDYHTLDMRKENWQHGWGQPDRIRGTFAHYFLWKDIPIMSFEEFISK